MLVVDKISGVVGTLHAPRTHAPHTAHHTRTTHHAAAPLQPRGPKRVGPACPPLLPLRPDIRSDEHRTTRVASDDLTLLECRVRGKDCNEYK